MPRHRQQRLEPARWTVLVWSAVVSAGAIALASRLHGIFRVTALSAAAFSVYTLLRRRSARRL